MKTSIGDDEHTQKMKVLSNPIRQKILKTISDQGSISFSLLKEELEMTDGNLFYHLKSLERFVQKDQQNFYQLNEEGKTIVYSIFHEEAIPTIEPKKVSWFLDIITFPSIFYYFFGDPVRSLLELNILLIITAWLFGVSNSHFSSIENIFLGGPIINAIISFVHWYFYLFLIFMLLKIIRYEINFKELWIGVFVGIIPYIVYLIPAGILYYTNTPTDNWIGIILNIVFILCKIYSTILVAQGINLSSDCKKYQALILAGILILMDYIYFMVAL
jgi:DNA-binding transcriptional ArsR family regulator